MNDDLKIRQIEVLSDATKFKLELFEDLLLEAQHFRDLVEIFACPSCLDYFKKRRWQRLRSVIYRAQHVESHKYYTFEEIEKATERDREYSSGVNDPIEDE